MKKKYRWNVKKCFKNVGLLVYRGVVAFAFVFAVLCFLGIY